MNLVALARLDCVLSGRLIDHYGYQAVKAEAEFDSWLTVGITEGNTRNELSSIGINFETWCAQPAQRSQLWFAVRMFNCACVLHPGRRKPSFTRTMAPCSGLTLIAPLPSRTSLRVHLWVD
jgi:hypothetical protein